MPRSGCDSVYEAERGGHLVDLEACVGDPRSSTNRRPRQEGSTVDVIPYS